MARIAVEILPPDQCEQRSLGTDPFAAGWWYHGTTYRTAKAILCGKEKIRSPFWLTRNPAGASQHHGTTVIRCTTNLHSSRPPQPRDDRYYRKGGNEGLDQPYEWIGVFEGRVYIANNSLGCQSSPETEESKRPPTVGEELKRITRSANNRVQATWKPRA